MASILALTRLIFTGFLVVVFLYFFGYPALMKYSEKSVLIKVSAITSLDSGIPPPSITFCPLTPTIPLATGWKNSTGDFHHVLQSECGLNKSSDQILNCVNKKTYSLNEALLDAKVGMYGIKSLMNSSYWTTYLTVLGFGNCFMLKYEDNFTTDWETNTINLSFNKDLMYDIFFHDPKFFMITANLKINPAARFRKAFLPNVTKQFDVYPIVVTEHRRINRAEAPCVEDKDYKLESCVEKSLVEKLGCRYPWDRKNRRYVPVCDTVEKILDLEAKFYSIGKDERKNVVAKTGCLAPCRYREYKILSDIMKGLADGFGVGVVYPSTEIRLEEEEYIYPLISFISEFGGALGMFLGFSFNMLWDFIFIAITFIQSKK